MKILFKYPTRQRPDKFVACISTYYKLLRGADYQFVVTVDNDDEQMKSPVITSFASSLPNLTIKSGDSKSKIEAIRKWPICPFPLNKPNQKKNMLNLQIFLLFNFQQVYFG